MDFAGKSAAELQTLLEDVTAAYVAADSAERAEKGRLRAEVGQAVDQFTALLGPTGPQPGHDSIRALLALDAEDNAAGNPRGTALSASPAPVLSLLVEGLEHTAATVAKLARLMKEG